MARAVPHTGFIDPIAAKRCVRAERARFAVPPETVARWREEHREFTERSQRWQADLAEIAAVFAIGQDDARTLCLHFKNEAVRRHPDLKEHVRLVLAERRQLTGPTAALASAEAIRGAIAALPVGRDIRTRLNALLDTHVAVLGNGGY